MAEAQNAHVNTNGKKRKGFWANLFGKSSNTDEKKEDAGFMGTFRQAATKGVMNIGEDVAKKEIEKEIEAQLNNNDNNSNGSQQPASTTTASAIAESDTSATSEMLSSPTNWAKRMVDTAQQKVQSLTA